MSDLRLALPSIARNSGFSAIIVLTLAIVGVIAGMGAALLAMQGLRSFLFGVTTLDSVSYAFAPAILVPITLLTRLLPALRASRVDPVSILKAE